MERTILHCDLNSFYASVECVFSPELKNVPMAVGGEKESRHGIILAKNELAKEMGVKTAETIWQAKQKCPDLVIVPPRYLEYDRYSKKVRDILFRFTDLVEPFGIDESWLDVTGTLHLFGDGKTIADTIRKTVKEETGLTVSVGVSFNKVFSKLGSDYKKPDATTVITRENFKEIVFPLPVSDLLFVGKAYKKRLDSLYIKTIGDLANADKNMLIGAFGKNGEYLYNCANGFENSPVIGPEKAEDIKSIGNGITFKRNIKSRAEIKKALTFLSDKIATRMRYHQKKCMCICVSVKDPDFVVMTRQKTLSIPSFSESDLARISFELIEANWDFNKEIRAITVTGKNLVGENEGEQQDFFTRAKREKKDKIEKALYDIRKKYGRESVKKASSVNNDFLP